MAKRKFVTKEKLNVRADAYRAWSAWVEGDTIVGKYIAKGKDQYEKPSWILEIEDAMLSDKKLSKLLIGKKFGMNSNGAVDKSMEKVEIGQYVQVVYNGTEEMAKGPYKGKEKHLVDIEIVEPEDGDDEQEDDEDLDGEL